MRGHRHRLLTVTGLAGMLALSAGFPAGGGSGGFPTKEVPPEEWVESLCTSFLRWAEDLAAAREDPDLTADDLKVRKAALIQSLEAEAQATTDLLRRFKRSGTPDVENGKAIAKTFRKGYAQARDTFLAAVEDAEELRTRNLEDFEEDLLKLQEQIVEGAAQVGDAFDAAAEKYDTTELSEVFQAEPTCTGVA